MARLREETSDILKPSKLFIFYPFVQSFGGIERLLIDFHQQCHGRGIETALVCFKNAVDFCNYTDLPFEIVELAGPRSVASEMLRLRRWSKTLSSDQQLLVMEMCGVLYGPALQCRYALHIADTPDLLPRDIIKYSYTAGIRSFIARDRPSFLRRLKGELTLRLVRRGVRGAFQRLTMTDRNRLELESTFGAGFVVAPPGIAEVVPDDRPNPPECVFLSVCRLEPSKRVDWIIRSFSEIPASLRANARLDIVGDGSCADSLKSVATECGLTDQVKFPGHVSEEQLEACYQNSSVFVMPAKQGYGLPGLEALARGLRLIVHKESGVSEILQSCDRAFLINDQKSLTDAMVRLCSTHQQSSRKCLNLRTRDQWCQEILDHCGWASKN